jgi:hypothetical protein
LNLCLHLPASPDWPALWLIFDTRLAEVGHRQRVTILKIA